MADNELIREINEDLRRDRMEKMWREFGKHILGLSVAVVVVTIGIVLWQDYTRQRNTEATAQYSEAAFLFSHEKYAEAAEAFAKVHNEYSGGIAAMAGIKQGQALLALGKTDEALAAFKEVAASRADAALKGLAGLLAAAAEYKKTGHMPAISVELQDSKNPFAYTAREMAALQLMEAGKKDEAATLLRSVADDENAPPTLRTRAEMLAGMLGKAGK